MWSSQYLQLGAREGDRPPRSGQRKIRLQQLDLDAAGLNRTHRLGSRIPVYVGIMKLLPPIRESSSKHPYDPRCANSGIPAFQHSSILSKAHSPTGHQAWK
jgi:hypothetical protein